LIFDIPVYDLLALLASIMATSSAENNVFGAKVTVDVSTEERKNSSHPPAGSDQADQTRDFDPCIGAKPHSPFYCHPTTRTSLEQLKCEVKVSCRGYYSQDLESGMRTPPKRSVEIHRLQSSKLWKSDKRKHCGCLRTLSKKQRLSLKILIAILLVGAMVGIALGITAAVGGGVWRSNNRQTPIGG
jgi:hypothetical protein